MTSIKLWYSPFTRATRPRWLLEELAVPYELVLVDLKQGAHKQPAYLENVHPHGAVPAAEIDGQVIIESAAIVAALADRFLDRGLAPAPSSPERALYLQWLFYSQVTLEPALIDVLAARKPDSETADDKKAAVEEKWRVALGFVERGLGEGPWILGERFSAADCILGALLLWANSTKLLEAHPTAVAYAERCRSRPAFQRARK